MLKWSSVNIPANIHIAIVTITPPLLRKLLPGWGQLVYLLSPLPSFHWGASDSLLVPPVLCKRTIRWGPTIITQVSKWLWFWTLEPGEKVWEDNWILWLLRSLNKWIHWPWLRGGEGSAIQQTPQPSWFGTWVISWVTSIKQRTCTPLEYRYQH